MVLRARQFEFSFPRPVMIMGILNVTPDSFFDGGRFFQEQAAVTHAHEMIAEGADVLDVGGESTRPYSTPESEAEELRRVLPVIKALAPTVPVPISIDTRKTAVARAAVEAGASIINDVGAARADDGMRQLVAESGAAYVAMHSQGTPETMQINPVYRDVVAEVTEFFEGCGQRLQAAGVKPEQMVFDPGIGFGKTAGHNLELLAHLGRFAALNRPLLLGVSRKAFLGGRVEERLPAALACACWGARAPAQIIRVHDVAATRQAVRFTESLMAYHNA